MCSAKSRAFPAMPSIRLECLLPAMSHCTSSSHDLVHHCSTAALRNAWGFCAAAPVVAFNQDMKPCHALTPLRHELTPRAYKQPGILVKHVTISVLRLQPFNDVH